MEKENEKITTVKKDKEVWKKLLGFGLPILIGGLFQLLKGGK